MMFLEKDNEQDWLERNNGIVGIVYINSSSIYTIDFIMFNHILNSKM